MKFYDYLQAEKEDILNALQDYLEDNELTVDDINNDDILKEDLYNTLWVDDSITGNGSGSYTFDELQAQANLVGNFDLAQEALSDLGYDSLRLDKLTGEFLDVTIRCYLLSQALDEILDELD